MRRRVNCTIYFILFCPAGLKIWIQNLRARRRTRLCLFCSPKSSVLFSVRMICFLYILYVCISGDGEVSLSVSPKHMDFALCYCQFGNYQDGGTIVYDDQIWDGSFELWRKSAGFGRVLLLLSGEEEVFLLTHSHVAVAPVCTPQIDFFHYFRVENHASATR